MKKNIIIAITFFLLGLSVAVGATILYNAKDIEFTPSDESWNVDNMQDAINDIKENYTPNNKVNDLINQLTSWEYEYTGTYDTFNVLVDGTYKIELWGAQGNYGSRKRAVGGKGAYSSGEIELTKGTKLYIYVGENRTDRSASFNAGSTGGNQADTVNGGSTNGYGGGGSTDIRLVSGEWNNTTSLASRIMVAAGGGGATDYAYPVNGGYGGALIGGSGFNGKYPNIGYPNIPPTGANQTNGGETSKNNYTTINPGYIGNFGIGGNGNSNWGSGGGGGYYGGAGGGITSYSVDSGAGGSSFISGHTGCVAINSATSIIPKTGCNDGTNNIECSYHYSGYRFTKTNLISGNESMPSHDGTSTMTGNSGNGYAKITLVSLD